MPNADQLSRYYINLKRAPIYGQVTVNQMEYFQKYGAVGRCEGQGHDPVRIYCLKQSRKLELTLKIQILTLAQVLALEHLLCLKNESLKCQSRKSQRTSADNLWQWCRL